MKLSLVVLALLMFSGAASAQERAPAESMRALASAHVIRGTEFFRQKAFAAALLEFQRAYAIDADYRLLYDIGKVKRELEDYAGAAQSFERYIVEGRRVNPSGRSAPADGGESGATPAVSITVTFHRLEVDARTVEKLASLGEGENASALKLVLDELRARESAPENPTPSPSTRVAKAEPEPEVAAPEPALHAAAPRTRVARGIDDSDPYSLH